MYNDIINVNRVPTSRLLSTTVFSKADLTSFIYFTNLVSLSTLHSHIKIA